MCHQNNNMLSKIDNIDGASYCDDVTTQYSLRQEWPMGVCWVPLFSKENLFQHRYWMLCNEIRIAHPAIIIIIIIIHMP